MVGYLLVTHGEIGSSLADCVYHIFNKKISRLDCISINPTDDIDKKKIAISQKIKKNNSGDSVIIFTDIIGATPCNILKDFIIKNKVEVLTGVNAAMLIKALSSKNKDLNNIIQDCLEAAEENILQIDPND